MEFVAFSVNLTPETVELKMFFYDFPLTTIRSKTGSVSWTLVAFVVNVSRSRGINCNIFVSFIF